MLMSLARAYSSFCSQVISVYLAIYSSQQKIEKSLRTLVLGFNVI